MNLQIKFCSMGMLLVSFLYANTSQAQYKKAAPLDSKNGLKSVWMESETIEPSGYKGGPADAPVRKTIPMAYSRFKNVHSAAQWDIERASWYGTLAESPVVKFQMRRADGLSETYNWTTSTDAFVMDLTPYDETTFRQFKLSSSGSVVLSPSSWIDATGRNPANPYSYSKTTIKWHPKYDGIVNGTPVISTQYQSNKGIVWPPGTTGGLTPVESGKTVGVVREPVSRFIKIGTEVLEYTLGALSGGGSGYFSKSPGVGATAGAFGVWLGKNKPMDVTTEGTYDYEMWARSVHADQKPKSGEPSFININPHSLVNTLSTPGEGSDTAWQTSSATNFGLRHNISTFSWTADEYSNKGYVGPASGTRTQPYDKPTVMGFFTASPY